MRQTKMMLVMAMVSAIAGSVMAADPAAVPAPAPKSANIMEGYSLPFKKYEISFNAMGVINKVNVVEGQTVKEGELLMQQDDREEKAELDFLNADAKNKLPVKAAEANAVAKEWAFKAKDRLQQLGHGVELEWQQAKADWEIAKVQIEQAEKEQELKAKKAEKQQIHVDRMKLLAPCNGVVLKLNNDLGANVDPTKPSIVLLKNDPVLVVVQVPALASLKLKLGDPMRVSYDKKDWSRTAKVYFLSPQAYAGAGMREIRLEMPNSGTDPSGLPMYVELPDSLIAAADGK